MITGFNTDIKYGGVTYHVQTEDKGVDSPLILSLVYVGGAIIASKRTRYEDLVKTGFDEKELTERLQRQHKLICAAIKAGRVDELKRMSAPNGGAAKAEADEGEGAPKAAAGEGAKPEGQRKKKSEPAPGAETAPPAEAATPPPVEASPVKPTPPAKAAPPAVNSAPTVETAPPAEAAPTARRVEKAPEQPLEPPTRPPAKPPIKSPVEVSRVASPGAGRVKPADPEVVILTTLADEVSALGDFLYNPKSEPPPPPAAEVSPEESEPIPVEPIPVTPLEEDELTVTTPDISNELDLHLLDDEGDFRAGQLATVKVYVGRGPYGQRPVFDAPVTVKVLGTSFRPIILTTTTDDNGVAVVRALLPRFNSGRAAIIIRATVGEDSAELRRIIRQ